MGAGRACVRDERQSASVPDLNPDQPPFVSRTIRQDERAPGVLTNPKDRLLHQHVSLEIEQERKAASKGETLHRQGRVRALVGKARAAFLAHDRRLSQQH